MVMCNASVQEAAMEMCNASDISLTVIGMLAHLMHLWRSDSIKWLL